MPALLACLVCVCGALVVHADCVIRGASVCSAGTSDDSETRIWPTLPEEEHAVQSGTPQNYAVRQQVSAPTRRHTASDVPDEPHRHTASSDADSAQLVEQSETWDTAIRCSTVTTHWFLHKALLRVLTACSTALVQGLMHMRT